MEWITTSTVLSSLRDFDNRAAWSQFVDRFRLPVFRFALSTGLGDTDAEDVAQETLAAFAESFRKGQYDRSKGRLSQWLFGIAFRKSQDERRKGARRHIRAGSSELGSLSQIAIADEASLSLTWDREWEQALLEQCLDQVRREVEPITFRAFELVVRENQDANQAAETLGVNVKLVYNAKHRVLKRLREIRSEFDRMI
ncbi:MAG: sigma-70 family RNA polymerase sigma factor [Planctomycetes bacterium]|nr:sigma-70 family RNA polymerase sigma factor [Planctomycetota bacterium]